jgi:hypothetical protein
MNNLNTLPLEPNVERELDPNNPGRVIFWRDLGDGKKERIWNNTNERPIQDSNLQWVSGFKRVYEKTRTSILNVLLRKKDQNVLVKRNGERMTEIPDSTQPIFIAWSENAEEMQKEIQIRHPRHSGKADLGPSITQLSEAPFRTQNTADGYIPEQKESWFAPDKAKMVFIKATSKIFEKISNLKKDCRILNIENISVIKKFIETEVAWAYISGDKLTRETKDISKTNLIAALPPQNIDHAKPQAYCVTMYDEYNMFIICPYGVSEEWAGLIGVHEMQHLLDLKDAVKTKFDPNRELIIDMELRAYTTQIAAAELISNNRFKKLIHEVADFYKINTMEEALKLTTYENLQQSILICKELDCCITDALPLSRAEAHARRNFYGLAIAFDLAERLSISPEEADLRKKQYIETTYDIIGSLPRK